MQTYPSKELIIRSLLQAARTAAENSTSKHPEDIAVTMASVIENSAPLIMWLYEEGYLK